MEPLDRFREIAKDQVIEIKASPELKQATLARIRSEQQKSRKRKSWVWPALGTSVAAVALVLFLNFGAFDLDSGSRPGLTQGMDGPVAPTIEGEPPDSGIGILTDPGTNSLFSDEGEDSPENTVFLDGEPVPLPSYIPAGFHLQDINVREHERSVAVQYTSLEQEAHFNLLIEKRDQGEYQRETAQSPILSSTEPLTATWDYGPWHYTLTGQLAESEVDPIVGSLELYADNAD